MKKVFDKLDHFLEETSFLCGNRLSIADLLLFHEAYNIAFYDYDISSWKNVNSWYQRMLGIKEINEIHQRFQKERPSIQLLNEIMSVKIVN